MGKTQEMYRPQRSISTTEKVFRDDFPGNALDASVWETPVIAGAATVVVSGSNMVCNLTTGATDSITLVSKVAFDIPFRLMASLLLSARSANQLIIVEAISESFKASAGATGHYAQWSFDGTTATAAKTRTRNADTAGTDTARTISTTAATTRIYSIDLGYDDVRFSQIDVDSTAARGAVFVHTAKVPPADESYFIRITVKNTGASTALAATFDFVAVQDVTEVMAEIVSGTGYAGPSQAVPVNVVATITQPVTASGAAAHDAAVSGSPVRVGARAVSANYAAVSSGDTADLITTLVGALVVKQNAIPENDWQYAAASGGIVNTTDVAVKAAAAAGIRNYVTGIQLRNTNAVATEFVIKDGATVIWRTQLPANMTGSMEVAFQTPLKGTAATAVNVACITTAAAVYCNVQGFIAP